MEVQKGIPIWRAGRLEWRLTLLSLSLQESFQKPSHGKYSKYDVWQKKSSQRRQRDAPNILRARQYRWQAEGLQAAEEAKALHRPLISLPSQRPPAARASPETAGPQK